MFKLPTEKTEAVRVNPRKMFIFAHTKTGKALCLETLIPTPNGFKKVKDLGPGDTLFDEKGFPTKILSESEIFNKPTYEIIFDDGNKVITCEDHLWEVEKRIHASHEERKNKKNKYKLWKKEVINTKEIFESGIFFSKKRSKYKIKNCKPVNYPVKDLPIDPYLLGLWLGDGSSYGAKITTADNYILDKFKEVYNISNYSDKYTYGITTKNGNCLSRDLRILNLFGNKHIPDMYMHSSVNQRLELLRGLMDSDGCVERKICTFSQTKKELTNQVKLLIESLGIKTTVKEKYNKNYKTISYIISFSTNLSVFNIPRKKQKQYFNNEKSRSNYRFIKEVNLLNKNKLTKCFTVDSENSLFLCNNFIVTHNTDAVAQLENSLLIDLESGSQFVSANRLDVRQIANDNNVSTLEVLGMIVNKLKESEHKYDYIILDTATELTEIAKDLAAMEYRKDPMGKSWKGTDITQLPMGKGYGLLRDAYKRIYNMFDGLANECLILLGHVKDSSITKNGEELKAKDVQLVGR